MKLALRRGHLEVRRTHEGLIVTTADAAVEAVLGVALDSLLGTAWGTQFVAADRTILLRRSTEIIDRTRHVWHGDLELSGRPGAWVHVRLSRPCGSLHPRLTVELTEVPDRVGALLGFGTRQRHRAGTAFPAARSAGAFLHEHQALAA